ncbi:Sdd2 protein [Starmerella bacillaris]|uniref:Sdd2 protein n=1 Tax=Starmerella bacillaris TaxID=1247836 RepID=A0AAV5RMW6_STABA|nr:Sdd2 protein [Starmerella bacillaris]
MDDDELRRIREARLQELKSKRTPQDDKQDEMKAAALSQILQQDARERLNRIRIVNSERAEKVEQLLMRLAQSGQLQGRISDPDLVHLLNKMSQQEQQSSKLVFSRRGNDFSDEEGDVISSKDAKDESDDDFFD